MHGPMSNITKNSFYSFFLAVDYISIPRTFFDDTCFCYNNNIFTIHQHRARVSVAFSVSFYLKTLDKKCYLLNAL